MARAHRGNTVEVDTLKDVVVIPEAAIQRGPSGFFAYVVEDGKANIVQLDIVARDSGLAALKGGIEPGAKVITSGF